MTILDSAAPQIALNAPATLATANHKYVTITVAQMVASVSDACTPLSARNVVVASATSDEAEDARGTGDGATKNDIVIAPGCGSVQLRAERAEELNGRVYSITLEVKDASGNAGTAVYKVFVPASRGGGAVDDGVARYTVSGCAP